VSETNRTHATGRIEVESYEPQPYDEVSGGPNVVEIHVREAFKGDIEAKGVVRFLQAVRDDGSASFVGIERVTGTLGGRQGSFLLQDMGTLEGEHGERGVVRDSGLGDGRAHRTSRRGRLRPRAGSERRDHVGLLV